MSVIINRVSRDRQLRIGRVFRDRTSSLEVYTCEQWFPVSAAGGPMFSFHTQFFFFIIVFQVWPTFTSIRIEQTTQADDKIEVRTSMDIHSTCLWFCSKCFSSAGWWLKFWNDREVRIAKVFRDRTKAFKVYTDEQMFSHFRFRMYDVFRVVEEVIRDVAIAYRRRGFPTPHKKELFESTLHYSQRKSLRRKNK